MPSGKQRQEGMSINHEVDDCSDGALSYGDDPDPDPDVDESEDTLRSIEKRRTIKLSLHGNYTDWIPHEAFRELVQNWRDAIIESNHQITSSSFCVHREEASTRRNTEIVYKVFQRGADRSKVQECLGFIYYKGSDGAGTVGLINLNATLQPWHLQIGGTTKRGAEDQVGVHGEGLKLAALVLMRGRQNNSFRCHSGGFNWTFGFDKQGRLVATLHRMDMASQKAQQPKWSSSKIVTPEVMADRDVHFIIGGQKVIGRDERGVRLQRGLVQQTAFESWTKVALCLSQADNADNGAIETYHGDLLTAENLRGNIYLRGLLLSEGTKSRSASLTGLPLWFGYNFAGGQTNRERQSVATASEESRAMCQILSAAMKERPDMIGDLVDMLNNTETNYADVSCAERYWLRDVGLLIRDYLLRNEFADRWLYCGEDMNEDPRLRQAIEGIGRKPYEVSKKCWNILKRNKVVRTAAEEALWHFEHVDVVVGPYHSFGTSVSLLLRACIRACPQAPNMKIEFMNAGQLHLDVAISEDNKLLRVHERWLSMEDALAELGLFGKIAEDKVVILTVKNLFVDVLEQLPRKDFQQEGSARSPEWHLKQEINRAEERLINYHEMEVPVIKKSDNGHPGLCVEWAVKARPQDDNAMIEVQCHRVSQCCFGLRKDVFIASDVEAHKMACITEGIDPKPELQVGDLEQPTCRACQVPFQQGMHHELGLKEGEEYFFVLVTPTDPSSFVSMSANRCVVAQSAVLPNPTVTASAETADYNGGSQNRDHDIYMEGESSIVVKGSVSPEPVDGIPHVGRAHDASEVSRAASSTSNRHLPRITPRSFSLESRLSMLDLLAIDFNRLYKAGNSKNVQAFIGFMKGQPSHPEESRKRRRGD